MSFGVQVLLSLAAILLAGLTLLPGRRPKPRRRPVRPRPARRREPDASHLAG